MTSPNRNTSSSYFETATGLSVKPLWFTRGFTVAALIPLLLALFVWTSGSRHDFCIGLAVGLLVGLLVQTFANWDGTEQ